jgi:hypothetical protein
LSDLSRVANRQRQIRVLVKPLQPIDSFGKLDTSAGFDIRFGLGDDSRFLSHAKRG